MKKSHKSWMVTALFLAVVLIVGVAFPNVDGGQNEHLRADNDCAYGDDECMRDSYGQTPLPTGLRTLLRPTNVSRQAPQDLDDYVRFFLEQTRE